jgi:Flp pilus assembly protein TadD
MQNEHPKAIEDADFVTQKLDPKNSKAFYRKGMSLIKLGKNDEAMKALQQASNFEPQNELYTNELKNLKELSKKKHK